MQSPQRIALLCAFALALKVGPAFAVNQQEEGLRALRQAKSEAEMDVAVMQITEERLAFVQEVIHLLQESKAPEVKVRACYLLGELRDPRSSRDLSANLLLKAEVPDEYRRMPRWSEYPCQEALAKIGKPAERFILEIFSTPAGDDTKAAALHVLQSMEGWRGAVFVLEQAWEQAGPEERKGLEIALEQARKSAR